MLRLMGLSYVKIDGENEGNVNERNEWNSWKIQAYDTIIIHRHQNPDPMRLVAR